METKEGSSLDFNAKDAIKKIKGLESLEEVGAFIQGDERVSVLNAAEAKLKGPGVIPAPAAKKAKGPTDDQILEAYDKLEFLLAEKTSVEKLKNMPFKFYFVHFRQVSRLKKQFERTRRT